jgi:hypothetical protein
MNDRVSERGVRRGADTSPARPRTAPQPAVLRLQRMIGNRATCQLIQRQDEDDEVDPELAALYIWDRSIETKPTLGDFMPPMPVGVPKQAMVENLPLEHSAVLIPVPVVEAEEEAVEAAPEGEKRKRNKPRKRNRGKKAEAATAPGAPAAAPAAPRVNIPDIRIPGLAHGTIVGNQLRMDDEFVATVGAEQLNNTAGSRGVAHQVPLDILADATYRALKRLKLGKADEKAGNFAYFWPVGADHKTHTYLCVVLNKFEAVVTSYTTSRRDAAKKIGVSETVMDEWGKAKKVYPSWPTH